MFAVILAIIFALAGTTKLPLFWAVFSSQMIISLISLFVLDPDLISERFRPRGEDQDTQSVPLIVMLFISLLVICALDVRFHWTMPVPIWLQWTACVLQALGWLGFGWTMHVNRYFSSAVRMQEDRGQTVIVTGPYHWIRHPGYGFAILSVVFMGLALGSWLSLIPAVLTIMVLFRRTLMEEKMLFENLQGYPEYAEKVRYRWIPFIF
jgi:protein-S-isoprenylcysteine O-methyltransferase Ste14